MARTAGGHPADRPGLTDAVVRGITPIRPGEVATYGEIAEEAGYPGAARAVGGVMARSDGLPWWRVVAANGRLVPGHEAEQARRLRKEGVMVGRDLRLAARGSKPGRTEVTPPLSSSVGC